MLVAYPAIVYFNFRSQIQTYEAGRRPGVLLSNLPVRQVSPSYQKEENLMEKEGFHVQKVKS